MAARIGPECAIEGREQTTATHMALETKVLNFHCPLPNFLTILENQGALMGLTTRNIQPELSLPPQTLLVEADKIDHLLHLEGFLWQNVLYVPIEKK